MMRDGERQVAQTVEEIRRDHVARYEFAARRVASGDRVIDFACGVGYGCDVMARAGLRPHGVDIDKDAVDYARVYFGANGATFGLIDGNEPGEIGEFDAATCFEAIEHIEDPRPMLKALRKAAPLLMCSVPNEDVMPWEMAPGVTTRFHFRHYTKSEFASLLKECGWDVTQWHGQLDQVAEVKPDVHGRTLVAVCSRGEVSVPAPQVPNHVAILGLGPSVTQWLEIAKRMGGRHADETWGINALGDVFHCDRVFHQDDVRIQEVRAAANPEGNIAAMLKWMKTHPGPIYTSRKHEDYPGLVEFPLADVVNKFGQAYFNSTAAYAVAYAIYIGVKKISLYGMDYTYKGAHHAEKGRACVEFWLGIAVSKGIELAIPHVSSLMDACSPEDRLYGYDTLDVEFSKPGADGAVHVSLTPKETALPTAAEIEARYDHNKHPNPLVAEEVA